MKNDYQAKQRAIQQAFLDTGEEMGMQKMWDYIQVVLRDPNVVGKDVFGPKRLEKIYTAMSEMADEYHTAFTDTKEADYYQEKLDRLLSPIWGDRFEPFEKRYPKLKKAKYDKTKKGWI